jgi:hypothetical protein
MSYFIKRNTIIFGLFFSNTNLYYTLFFYYTCIFTFFLFILNVAGAIFHVNATVIEGDEGMDHPRIDLVENLINEQVIHEEDDEIVEHQYLKGIANASRLYTYW